MSSFYKLVIREVRRETPEAVSILFTVPEDLKHAYAFTAGQYVNLKLTLDGKELRRAYSICSAPGSGELRIAVKAIQRGTFSTFANQCLKAGDILEVGVPEGNFTFTPHGSHQKNYMGFAAGSGITPVISIVKSVLNDEPNSTFVLVYGNKRVADTLFFEEIKQLQQQYTGRFFIHFVFSQSNESDLFGRIDKSVVNFVLHQKHPEKTFDTYYLCGPEEMINTVSEVLKSHSVPEKKIRFELFSTSAPADNAGVQDEGHTAVTILLDDEETTFEMSRKQTVLEAALKQGLDAPYSCQGGICSSCMARITKGSAVMKKNTILTDKEVEDGLVLTCQAHPTTAEIVVDFDDL